MANRLLIALFLACPMMATGQDFRTARLEQDVQQLQREVLTLSQLVSQLRARVEGPGTAPPSPSLTPGTAPAAAAPLTPVPRWVDASRWQRVCAGMAELEVLGELGPPSSMRMEGGERVLLYALEIGRSGFLAGSVRLRDRAVTAVETPTLK